MTTAAVKHLAVIGVLRMVKSSFIMSNTSGGVEG
jgi:hypothetical protein